jgi:hypothetical protein
MQTDADEAVHFFNKIFFVSDGFLKGVFLVPPFSQKQITLNAKKCKCDFFMERRKYKFRPANTGGGQEPPLAPSGRPCRRLKC